MFKSDELFKEFDGDVHFEYRHEEYWMELVRMTDEIRERRFKAWRALGGGVGVKEWDIKTWVSSTPRVDADGIETVASVS